MPWQDKSKRLPHNNAQIRCKRNRHNKQHHEFQKEFKLLQFIAFDITFYSSAMYVNDIHDSFCYILKAYFMCNNYNQVITQQFPLLFDVRIYTRNRYNK